MAMPKTIGATIDLLYELREQRQALTKQIEALKEKEASLEDHLMTNFDRSGLDGAKGKLATASLKRSTVADVTDWDKLWAYIGKNKAYELVQKRASITALRERWDAGKEVPGVAPKEITTLSLVKA